MEKLKEHFRKFVDERAEIEHPYNIADNMANEARNLAIEFANWCMDRYIVNNAGRYMSKRPVGEHFLSYTHEELFNLFLSQKQF